MYLAAADRYQRLSYARCGRSGLQLPRISLGLWQNFGGTTPFENARDMVLKSFDAGITHFDLANNYGPPYGSAEANFGRILAADLAAYRDELIISTKAGYDMWPGPYGEWGSRKYLLASLDQSLKRLGSGAHGTISLFSHRLRPEHAARGNHGGARYRGAQRSGIVRRYFLLWAIRKTREGRGGHPARVLGTPA